MNQKLLSLVLAVCLAVSLGFNIYQFLNCNSETSVTKTFVWIGKNYVREDGVVSINATFDWSGSNLTIVILINDDELSGGDYVGLVFDKDKDENLFDEVAYLLASNNKIPPHDWTNKLEEWGGIYTAPVLLPPKPSPYHNCTFTEDGYTFNIEISKTEINFTRPMLTHLCFFDADAYGSASREIPLQEAREKAIVWVVFEV